MHTHNRFTAIFQNYPGEPVPEKIFFWTLWRKGRCQRQTQSGWHRPIQTNQRPASIILQFYAICPPAAALPIYPGLGQARNVLACIPSGLVKAVTTAGENHRLASSSLHPPPDSRGKEHWCSPMPVPTHSALVMVVLHV